MAVPARPGGRRSLWRDLSGPSVVAGFVAVLVGYTSSVVIVFQAAAALGATPAQTASWLWALGLGMGLTSAGPEPVVPAAGADRLVHAGRGAAGHGRCRRDDGRGGRRLHGLRLLITLAGASGLFARRDEPHPAGAGRGAAGRGAGALRLRRLPGAAHADAAGAADGRGLPRWAGAGGRATRCRACWPPASAWRRAGPAAAWRRRLALDLAGVHAPAFSLAALVGVALPLFVVTMASQNLPGVAAQRAAGYDTPVSPGSPCHRPGDAAAGARSAAMR
jgi:benzoate membrane transport protein